MLAYFEAVRGDPYQVIPPTYLVHPKQGAPLSAWPGWSAFEAHFARCAADPDSKNMWVLKPTSLNRGIGIEVFRTMEDITAFLNTKARGAAMGIQSTWVMQKYIERPLLYKGRKFDFRVWAVVLDSGDVYMYGPGYLRTSSEVFSLGSDDRYAHLTNYCQQVSDYCAETSALVKLCAMHVCELACTPSDACALGSNSCVPPTLTPRSTWDAGKCIQFR